MNKKIKIISQIVVIGLIIGFSFYKARNNNKKFNELKKQNFKTIGVITNQYSIGYASSFYVQYTYP